MNRDPMNKYRSTSRKMNGEITKDTHDGLSAWAYRNILANKKSPTADAELAALEDWEWETRMRIREVAALERIASALEHDDDTPQPEQPAQLMQGVGLDVGETVDGAYVRKPSIELRRGLCGYGGVWRDEERGSWFAMELDPEFRADTPDDLRDIAELFRSNFADALEWAAAEWQEQLDAGEVHLLEPDNDDDIADEDNELED